MTTLADDLAALGSAPTLAAVVDAAERWAVRGALRRASGSVRGAAAALDVPERTLHRRIEALGLRPWLTAEYERAARQPAR